MKISSSPITSTVPASLYVNSTTAHQIPPDLRFLAEVIVTEAFTSLDRFRINSRFSEDYQTRLPSRPVTPQPTDVGTGCNEWRFSETFGA